MPGRLGSRAPLSSGAPLTSAVGRSCCTPLPTAPRPGGPTPAPARRRRSPAAGAAGHPAAHAPARDHPPLPSLLPGGLVRLLPCHVSIEQGRAAHGSGGWGAGTAEGSPEQPGRCRSQTGGMHAAACVTGDPCRPCRLCRPCRRVVWQGKHSDYAGGPYVIGYEPHSVLPQGARRMPALLWPQPCRRMPPPPRAHSSCPLLHHASSPLWACPSETGIVVFNQYASEDALPPGLRNVRILAPSAAFWSPVMRNMWAGAGAGAGHVGRGQAGHVGPAGGAADGLGRRPPRAAAAPPPPSAQALETAGCQLPPCAA